ncbi:uncharacterized protein LOC130374432 isoform X2 [Gadus chalcogrammus]|uniref:uncharacterized protein LOC130374432 isoform X2 n=1 Tax=Gadus chalcogrammus TaxID=1042646 RepID=UPI0024C2D222|nr:uncharacterized protein LOC130374432 isoform X2 [Gadus chalcogrammus]XP_056437184.1 uncharacterized protein LOC130374432 isoform X2 [Gadus chalcogrammus]
MSFFFFAGRGVFAIGSFSKGDFIVEYRGDLISEGEAQKRRIYNPACSGFLYAFKLGGKTWCIDASKEDGSFGRLVNDDHRHPNARMKRIDIAGSTHLCLFALKDIKDGEEIAHNYGGEDCPWRKQMTTCEPETSCVSSQSVLMSEPQWDEAAWLEDTGQQMTTCEPETSCVSSQSVLMSEPQWDEAAWLEDTGQQMTTCEPETSCVSSQSVLMSEPQWDEAAWLEDTGQQMTTCEPETSCVSSQSVLMSEPQWDEAAWLEDTGQQMTTCEPETSCVSSQSVLMSEPQWDEAAWLEDTGQQMTTWEPDTHCVSSQPVLMSEPKWDEAAWLEDTGHQKRKLLEARRGNQIPAKQRRKLPPAEDGASSTVCAVSHVLPKAAGIGLFLFFVN